MSPISNSIRGTVQSVVGVTSHVIWWISWHTGGSAAERQTA